LADHRVRIKMCGMTRLSDIEQAIVLGVDAIGLIFYPNSPRCVSIKQAKQLLQNIPVFMTVLAVLVNPDSAFVKELIAELPFDGFQFHGQELPEFCAQFKKPYVKAIAANSQEWIKVQSAKYTLASAILLDTPTSAYGGTGESFPWGIIPKRLPKPLILAGGLNAENVRKAVELCSPYAVDVCSGIEAEPGVKDHRKMSQFVNALWGIHD
jgi:phosphoribosylanthranilate isomerase